MDRLRRMEIFNAVVEAGQFSRAATTLNLSKSAVSHAINDLEKFLGLQLLIRSNRSLQLTDEGKTYYEQSVRILSDITELENKTRDSDRAVSGRIRISAPLTFTSNNLSPIISTFMDANPAVTVELVLTERYIDLIEEGIDFAVRIGNLVDSRFVAHKISDLSHKICASPAFCDRHPNLSHLNALKSVNCLRFTGTPIWRLTKNGRRYNFTPKGTLISNNGEALRAFAIAGQGVAFLPTFLADPAIRDGHLKHILTDYKSKSLPMSIIRPPGRHFPLRVRRLIDIITKEISREMKMEL